MRTGKKSDASKAERRQYDSPLRRQQVEQTRDGILAAGAAIAHELPAWDWRGLTFKAVGERAGISERTVHRYFSTEKALRDAIIQTLVRESGVRLDYLELGDFARVTAETFRHLTSFAAEHPVVEEDPSFAQIDRQRRQAVLDAVERAAAGWTAAEREMAAAMMDALWHPVVFERLSTAWRLDADHATGALTWLIGLMEKAIVNGQKPAPTAAGPKPAPARPRKRGRGT